MMMGTDGWLQKYNKHNSELMHGVVYCCYLVLNNHFHNRIDIWLITIIVYVCWCDFFPFDGS